MRPSKSLCFPVTINCAVSQSRLNILKELDKIADVALFPIGQPQATTQDDADLVQKLHNKQSDFDPSAPCLKIWHEHSLAERIGS